MPAPYSATAVANAFLEIAESNGQHVTPMKLQKLVYFAHGWHLAIFNKPLISEEVQAWKFGPVIQSVYHEFKRYGARPITDLAFDVGGRGETVVPGVPRDDKNTWQVIEKIWSVYGKYTAAQLSSMTHQVGTPWEITWRDNRDLLEVGINNDLIRKYFVEKSQKNASARAAAAG